MRAVAVLIILQFVGAHSVAGQWPAGITTGARVQLRLPEVQYQPGGRGHLIRGRVSGLTPDTLYLAITDSLGPVPVPRRLIERLQFSRGVPSRLESGVRRGLITGAVFAVLTALWNEVDSPGDGRTSTGTAALVAGGVGLISGGALGAILPVEQWKRVPLDENVSNKD